MIGIQLAHYCNTDMVEALLEPVVVRTNSEGTRREDVVREVNKPTSGSSSSLTPVLFLAGFKLLTTLEEGFGVATR